jgi:hypothetical protein
MPRLRGGGGAAEVMALDNRPPASTADPSPSAGAPISSAGATHPNFAYPCPLSDRNLSCGVRYSTNIGDTGHGGALTREGDPKGAN